MPKYRRPEVCKPCWELKYCPYGLFVETMPLPWTDEERQKVEKEGFNETPQDFWARAKKTLLATPFDNEDELWRNVVLLLYADPDKLAFLEQYDPADLRCRVWGHSCPVFFQWSACTETKSGRRDSRRIPRDIMFKVARRDDYRCQLCGKTVADNEMEFDHIIPHSKGGPTTTENVRLLCRGCNRRKSDSLDELLDPERE